MKKSIALVAATTLALSSLSFNATAKICNKDSKETWALSGAVVGGSSAGITTFATATATAVAAPAAETMLVSIAATQMTAAGTTGIAAALCGPFAPGCLLGAVASAALVGWLVGSTSGKLMYTSICDK